MLINRRLSGITAAICLFILVSVAPSFAWKFASIADSRGTDNGVNSAELTKIINRVNSEGADLVLFEGDAVTGSTSDSTLSSQMSYWVSIMNKLNAPWYYCPGNHEITTSTNQSVLSSKVSQPTNGPSSDTEMVFSFNHQNAHFVFLNSNHYGQTHHVQRTWLSSDLAANTQPHVFVMYHEPAYPSGPHIGSSLDYYPSERDDLWNRMIAGHVSMVFDGHEHLYARSKHGSIIQVTNGSCGAPLQTGYSGTIGKYDYVIADVNNYTVTCTAKDDAGNVIDSWSYTLSTSQPSLSLTLGVDKATALPSDVITYTLTYKNSGAGAATNTSVELPIPPNTTYVAGSASSGGVYDSATNSVKWVIPSIAPGVSGQCYAKVKIN